MKIRDYQGLENWVHFNEYRRFLTTNKIQIDKYKGIHLFPFLISFLNPILKKMDKKVENKLGQIMLNISAYGTKA